MKAIKKARLERIAKLLKETGKSINIEIKIDENGVTAEAETIFTSTFLKKAIAIATISELNFYISSDIEKSVPTFRMYA